MADVEKSGMHEAELTDAELDKVAGGIEDIHFTKKVDNASPNLFKGCTPAPPPPPPKKA